MIFELNVHKGEILKTKGQEGEELYRCNFLTDDDDTITIYLHEEDVKQYANLKKYDPCKIRVKVYRAEKGKYSITGAY